VLSLSLSKLKLRGVNGRCVDDDGDVSLSLLVATSVYKLDEGDGVVCGDELGLALFVRVGTLPASASSEACQYRSQSARLYISFCKPTPPCLRSAGTLIARFYTRPYIEGTTRKDLPFSPSFSAGWWSSLILVFLYLLLLFFIFRV